MPRPIIPVTEADVKKSLRVLTKYLNQNGLSKKPYHFKHYILQNCRIGDYIMRVTFQESEIIIPNKLYKIVSGYSLPKNFKRTYWVIIDEKSKEYQIDASNFTQHYVYFPQEEVESKLKLKVPNHIIEYNRALAKKIKEKKQKNYCYTHNYGL